MTQIRKMFVVPEELFQSLLQRQKITENPILHAQMQIENEKSQLKPNNNEQTLDLYKELSFQQNKLDDQRKINDSKPKKVEIVQSNALVTNPLELDNLKLSNTKFRKKICFETEKTSYNESWY